MRSAASRISTRRRYPSPLALRADLIGFCSAPRVGGPIQAATAEIGSQVYARYVGVIREIAESGRLRVADADWAAQALWAACHGLVTLMITRPTINWGPADELTSITVGGLLRGLVSD